MNEMSHIHIQLTAFACTFQLIFFQDEGQNEADLLCDLYNGRKGQTDRFVFFTNFK